MSDVVRDAIAAELALIKRIVRTPANDSIGYGTDISCVDDVAEDVREVSGLLVLAQALVRRLDCPRGSLPDDPNYGIALAEYLNHGVTAADLRSVASKVRGELVKDDRVGTIRVIVEMPSTTVMKVRIFVIPVDVRLGPFTLTLAVTSASVLMEALER